MLDAKDDLFDSWFRFSALKGISNAAHAGLLRSMADTAPQSAAAFERILGEILPPHGRDFLLGQFRSIEIPAEVGRRMKICQIVALPYTDEDYPPPLREIADPPPLLYRKGQVPLWPRPRIAFVGSRTPTAYGRKCAWRLAAGLVESGVGLVSGLARGIDGIGHSAALEKQGETIAVCGCGLDMVYPQEHQRLFQRIAAKGTIYSEYPPGTPPRREHFPRRNRLMSGISDGVLVVEAAKDSGSLITARLALEQNREVYAVPGNIDSPRSAGSNGLLAQGARAVSWAQEIVAELQLKYGSFGGRGDLPRENTVDNLSPDENTVLFFLSHSAGQSWPQLQQALAPQTVDLAKALLALEMKGLIKQDRDGNYYSLQELKNGR